LKKLWLASQLLDSFEHNQGFNEAGSAGPNAGGHPAKASFGGDQLRTSDENRVISPLRDGFASLIFDAQQYSAEALRRSGA
jgi:hypothetical protein